MRHQTLLPTLRGLVVSIAIGSLFGCGGGGGGSGVEPPIPVSVPNLPLMVDSFGRALPEEVFAAGDGGATGGDGTAGDGAGFVNAAVTVVDTAGRSVTSRTDAQGYFRVRIDGFTPPFIASVVKPDGQRLYSPSVAPVKVRGFVTINITGLTDKIASDVALAAGRSGATEITPAIVAANPAAVQIAKAGLNTLLEPQIAAAGLPANFDPVTLPFRPDLTGYDKVLESVTVTRNSSGATVIVPKFGVSGTVVGLNGRTGLALSNAGETLNVPASAGTFAFAGLVAAGGTYNVSVASQPNGAICSVVNGTGIVPAAAVNNVSVVCSEVSFSLGGSVSGLGTATGLVLGTGGQTVTVPANATSFAFATAVPQGSGYEVAVQAQPAGITCSVSNGSGTIGSGPVQSVQVVCSVNTFTLGGTVSGLTAPGLVLAAGGQAYSIAAGAISFVFPAPFAVGSNPAISLQSQPAGQTCLLNSGTSGPVVAGAVNSIVVTCLSASFTVSATVNGYGISSQSGLVLEMESQTRQVFPSLLPTGSQLVTFPSPVTSGSAYAVTVRTQPPGQTCSVANGSGTIGSAPVTSVVVNCSTASYQLGGTITGLTGAGLVLAASGQTVAPPANANNFNFPAPVASGTAYTVTVQTQPAGVFCSVANGSGTVSGAAVTSVAVSCVGAYQVGGTIGGLSTSGLVLSSNGQSLTVPANATSFTFPTPVAVGSSYNVFVQSQPGGTSCSVGFGSGTVGNAPVTNVSVLCGPVVSTNTFLSFAVGGMFIANGDVYATLGGTVQRGPVGGGFAQIGGTAGPGFVNGPGPSASFNQPTGIVADGSGNVYVADTGNSVIRKMTPTNIWSTFAGSSVDGFTDGTGTAATFGSPSGLAIDGIGNLYVASSGRCACLRKITPAGVVTTLFTGWPNGFNQLAWAPSGFLYATTTTNELVQINPSTGLTSVNGAYSTININGSFVTIAYDGGIAADGSGNIYATSNSTASGKRVYKIAPPPGQQGSVFAGTGGAGQTDGAVAVATFSTPGAIAAGPGLLLVGENDRIRSITQLP